MEPFERALDFAARIVGEQALRQFEADQARRNLRLVEDALDVRGEIRTQDLRGGDVHGDLPRRLAGVQPGSGLLCGVAQDPKSELADQMRTFGDRNEVARWNEAMLLVFPARQRLEARD